jgi:hypothetical protein
VFGLGVQEGYGDYYCDAMEELYTCFKAAGAHMTGHWSTEGYHHNESKVGRMQRGGGRVPAGRAHALVKGSCRWCSCVTSLMAIVTLSAGPSRLLDSWRRVEVDSGNQTLQLRWLSPLRVIKPLSARTTGS